MTTAYATPPVASITPRDISFNVNVDRMQDWAHGDITASTWSNALSLMFPLGERLFIQTVAALKHEVKDPAQLAAVKAFVTQEGLHTREHLAYNQLMRPIVDVDAAERAQAAKQAILRKRAGPVGQLAVTVAAEHFTAILAHDFLKYPENVQNSERSFARLWTWHAIEECEHKSVAFDVFQIATKGEALKMRRITMVTVTINFLLEALSNVYRLYSKAGTNNLKSWAKMANYLLGKPGVLRRIFPAYLQFYRSDFHPSQIDDARELQAGLKFLDATA